MARSDESVTSATPLLRRVLQALRLAPRRTPIRNLAELREFLRTRASYVAQTALYGYLRTRAGTRYPELFSNDTFVASINIAKWQIWLACLSDLAVYAGGLVRQASRAQPFQVGRLMQEAVEEILRTTGEPDEAGPDFGAHAQRVRARLALCDWGAVGDDEAAFSESPAALVQWAPVAEDFKQLDEGIVRNSIRFSWQEVRRALRRELNAHALLATDPSQKT